MNLRQRLLQLLARRDYVPLTATQAATRLGVAGKEARALAAHVQRLLTDGTVVRIKGDRLCRPTDADLVTGTLHCRPSGTATLVVAPTPGQPEPPPAVHIAAEDTLTALHGDRVIVRLNDLDPPAPRRSGPPVERTGRVIRILERGRDTLTGTLQRTRQFFFVAPDDPRFPRDVYVPDPARSPLIPTPQVGDKVVVRLGDWLDRHVNPEGEIAAVLGRTFEPRAELAAIYHKFKLETQFPPEIEREVAALPDAVRPADTEHRLDLRSVPTFTIDPDDAKDFDDALSLEALAGGDWRVGVHIADVGAYVRPGTALDREAQRRGNSTYLVGTVVPMLPFKLSNGLCSLKEGEDRLTKSVLFTFAPNGRLKHTAHANTVIHSRKRLTYRQAFALLRDDPSGKPQHWPEPPSHQTGFTGRPLASLAPSELRELQAAIRTLWGLASHLRAERFRAGALELDVPETKIFVDAEGFADRIEKIVNDESHQLIEEFMLLANEAVARLTRQQRLASLYRVHDEPAPAKLGLYRQFAATLGVSVGDLRQRREMARLLPHLRSHSQGAILRVQLLRSLKRACYRATPDGHYGLAKSDYTHFTSPIRRYADLVVHRVFDAHLAKHRPHPAPRGGRVEARAERMPALAEHLSLTEQNSTEAERESVKVKLLEFFEREVKRKKRSAFAATIVEIRNHGLFVELVDSQAYGLIHVSTLRDDLYSVAAGGTALVGRRRKHRFALGQQIAVTVERVDRFKRQIDFRVAV